MWPLLTIYVWVEIKEMTLEGRYHQVGLVRVTQSALRSPGLYPSLPRTVIQHILLALI